MARDDRMIMVLIDNHLDHARMVEKYLGRERPGDPLVHFEEGMQAMEFLLACEGQATVVLVDVESSARDGHKVIHMIKRHHRLRRIPVIVFTTNDDQIEALRCYGAGCNLYLNKPVSEAEWPDVMRKLGSILSAMAIPV